MMETKLTKAQEFLANKRCITIKQEESEQQVISKVECYNEMGLCEFEHNCYTRQVYDRHYDELGRLIWEKLDGHDGQDFISYVGDTDKIAARVHIGIHDHIIYESEVYQYDEKGNLVRMIDLHNTVEEYEYDDQNNVIAHSLKDSDTGTVLNSGTIEYNSLANGGYIATETFESGDKSITVYDKHGRMVSEDFTNNYFETETSHQWFYNDAGSITEIRVDQHMFDDIPQYKSVTKYFYQEDGVTLSSQIETYDDYIDPKDCSKRVYEYNEHGAVEFMSYVDGNGTNETYKYVYEDRNERFDKNGLLYAFELELMKEM